MPLWSSPGDAKRPAGRQIVVFLYIPLYVVLMMLLRLALQLSWDHPGLVVMVLFVHLLNSTATAIGISTILI